MSQFATYPSLSGKTVLITGAAEGIGAAAVELFCRQGSQVVFLDYNEESAQKLIDKIAGIPGATTPTFKPCDVTDLDRLKQCAEEAVAASPHAAVDVLVNNAGAAGKLSRVPTVQVTPDTWDRDVNVNLRSQFFLTQAVVPFMQKQKSGSIINLGSITWRIPATDCPVYTACKAATMGMTRMHSKEFGGDNSKHAGHAIWIVFAKLSRR